MILRTRNGISVVYREEQIMSVNAKVEVSEVSTLSSRLERLDIAVGRFVLGIRSFVGKAT
jgi:hypothetical protein